MKSIFKNIFFWLSIVFAILSIFLFVSLSSKNEQLSNKNKDINNYKNINRKTYAYINQLNGSDFRDDVLDFVSNEDESVLKLNKWANYKNGLSEANIRIIYKKFDKSNMVATAFDQTESKPYLIGIEVKNIGENDITINTKEFFVKNSDNYYLPLDSSINNSDNKTSEIVTVEKGKTINIMSIYGFYNKESDKGLSVRYGSTTWK